MTLRQGFDPLTLRATGLTGRRGERTLFAGLDLYVPAGTGLLLRGPNGAGKTTLLLMLAGAIRAAAGNIEIVGNDPDGPPPLHFIGHRNAVRPRLSVRETLAFWADINGGGAEDALSGALARVGLLRLAGLDAGTLSAGQTRRLALARLLVTPRPVWLLDEPTAALDANGETLVGALLDEHLDQGGLAVLATHLPIPTARPERLAQMDLARGEAPA
jgi:heme exporter protein A